jgi:subtilisin family serine protease
MMTTHEALSGKWLSPYWLDAVNGQPTPYDDNGHGTAVCGVICGGDGPGPLVNDIGVAYGAKVIPTKAFTSGGSGTYASIDSCLQYLADLRTAGVAIRCANNSWGASSTTELHWWAIMLNMKTIGILPAAAVGSSGPGAGTACAPANYPTVIASGATDASDVIASFSSRGPAPDVNPWNDSTFWYYSSWDLLKPDVSAPGVSIRTAYNNGGYANMSGPSFAVAHASGGVALFCEKDSALTVGDLYYLFRAYCDEPSAGAPYPNNNYGWGRINLWRGMQAISPVEEAGSPAKDRLSLGIYPTIGRGRFNITYSIGQRAKSAELRIYGISGRIVKSFSLCSMPHALRAVWDGTDNHGRPVPAGVYLIELGCEGDRVAAKAVIAR